VSGTAQPSVKLALFDFNGTLSAMAELHGPATLFDGAADALREIHDAGYLMGVVSRAGRRTIQDALAHAGVAHLMDVIRTPDDGPSKPHPDAVLSACDLVGAAQADTVLIGDTTLDVATAKNAGVFAIGVTWGGGSMSALQQAGASALVARFADLLPLIRRLVGDP